MRWFKRYKWMIALVMIVWIGAVTYLSPELTIRRHLFTHLYLMESFTADVTKNGLEDLELGLLYEVRGYRDRATGDDISSFYVNRNGPFWTVTSSGTGP